MKIFGMKTQMTLNLSTLAWRFLSRRGLSDVRMPGREMTAGEPIDR